MRSRERSDEEQKVILLELYKTYKNILIYYTIRTTLRSRYIRIKRMIMRWKIYIFKGIRAGKRLVFKGKTSFFPVRNSSIGEEEALNDQSFTLLVLE
ncbi:hypothetical protein CG479_016380 [Bacillus cytotoxicus]|nr:hypothetical protein CG479_016380 [Bacillus cytotoxicus]